MEDSTGDGTFSVDFKKIKQAVADLDREFLTIEALGDYARARALMAKYVVIRPDVQKALDKMKAVPNDIRPAFVTAASLTGGDKRHLDVRQALRRMISLPQGTATTFGLADASTAAHALAHVRNTLSFSPGVEPSTPDLPFDWRDIRPMSDRMAQHLPRIVRGETEILKDRVNRLLGMLRGKAPRDHNERLVTLIDQVSHDMIGRATTEIKAWEDERRRQARILETEQHNRLIELLWRLSPESGTTLPTGPESLAWLISAPAGELSGALDLFNRGEAAVAALLPHVRDLVDAASKTVNIDDIHAAGRTLAEAAERARARLED